MSRAISCLRKNLILDLLYRFSKIVIKWLSKSACLSISKAKEDISLQVLWHNSRSWHEDVTTLPLPIGTKSKIALSLIT